ncbi:MAG: hypothetical protein SPI19_01495 [Peptoniphilaceae bacterium]|nr:hypothetical protein [Peptoniphilaceae bacterium]
MPKPFTKRRPEILAPEAVLSREGGDFRLVKAATIPGVPLLSMRDFDAQNHCTITGLTSIFSYYRAEGFVAIPVDRQALFETVREIAREGLRYHPRYGTFPWAMPSIARDVWAHYGYAGGATGHFFFTGRPSIVVTLAREIEAGRPGLINFTHNQYRDHSVTFTGYRCYVRASDLKKCETLESGRPVEEWLKSYPRMRVFLQVNNHWTRAARYVDLEHIGEGKETYFSLCLVHV